MTRHLHPIVRLSLRAQPWAANWDYSPWQAHRGYHLEGAPENTLSSLQEAFNRGAMMAEFDVRLTKDQVPVLFHDPDLTRRLGRPGWLHDWTLNELRQFLEVNTLEEVLRAKQVPQILNIEIKSDEIWNDPIERKVTEVIRRVGRLDHILFSSFNPVTLWKLTQLLPQIPRALLVSSDLENRWLREMAFAPLLKIQALHLHYGMLPNPESIHFWKKRGFRVAVWTVNDRTQLKQYLNWGVDSVITDLIP